MTPHDCRLRAALEESRDRFEELYARLQRWQYARSGSEETSAQDDAGAGESAAHRALEMGCAICDAAHGRVIEPRSGICDGCGNQVNWDRCTCGDPYRRHQNDPSLPAHDFVPVGCDCRRVHP